MAAIVYYRQVLTGGGVTALDAVDGALLNDGDPSFVFTGSSFYCYRLNATSGAAESSPDIIAPDANPGNKRWILQAVQNVGPAIYSNIIGDTTLATSYEYNDSAGTNTHTLPLLSGTTAGDRIKVYLTGTDRTVIINHNVADSAGAEKWTGVAVGDFVVLVSNGTAWLVADHYESHYCRVYVNADQSIVQGASEQVINISETTDLGGIWDAANNWMLAPFKCYAEIEWLAITNAGSKNMFSTVKIGAAFVRDYSAAVGASSVSGSPSFTHRIEIASSAQLTLWATNGDNNSGNSSVLGDVAGDESFATIKLTRVYS